jgi:hypothetical protein
MRSKEHFYNAPPPAEGSRIDRIAELLVAALERADAEEKAKLKPLKKATTARAPRGLRRTAT